MRTTILTLTTSVALLAGSLSSRVSTLKAEDLPIEMQKMTEVERKAHVDSKTKEREKLQAEIYRLNADRNRYVAEQSKKRAATNTLDNVVVTTIREQAAKRNYRFE